MGKWKEVVFSEICDFENGDRGKNYPSRSAYVENGIPFLSAGNILNNKINHSNLNYISRERFDLLGSGKVKRGDIVFCLRGSLGKFAIIEDDIDGGIASSLIILRPSKKVKLGFLKLFLESHLCTEMIKKYDNGSAQPNLSAASLKKFKIPLPPLPEQQRIVAKLDALFEKIDKAIALLEENIQHTQALMGSVLDEEFGKLECEKKEIKELVLKTKTANPKKDFPEDEFIYVDISSVNKEINHIEEPKNLLGKDAPSRARKVIQKGDVVFATTRPNLKNIAIVTESFDNPIASTGFCVLRANEELLNNEYLFYFLISDLVQEYIQPFIRGAQYPAISDKDLLSLKIPFLSMSEQKVKVIRIKNTFKVSKKLIQNQTQKLNNLKALKSSLLDKAFKGEL